MDGYSFVRWSFRGILNVGFGFTVTGADHVPTAGPVILAANHGRQIDPIILTAAVIGLLFQPPYHTLLWIGVLFGIGYGAYAAVDWALAIDVLPSGHSAAKDLGIWAIANTLPQVLAPVIAGPLLDIFNRRAPNLGYTIIYSLAIVEVALGSAFIWKIKGTR